VSTEPSANQIIGRYVDIEGTRTYYEAVGVGRPIVCVHTAGSDARQYRYMLPAMATRGFQAFALDLPGHGHSYPVRWDGLRTINEIAEFVHTFCTEVTDEAPVLVGVSIGGMVTLNVAAHHWRDYAAFVPMAAAAIVPTLPSAAEAELAAWCPSWADQMERGLTLASGATAEQAEELRWLHRSTGQLIATCDLQAWTSSDLRGALGDVRRPVLLMVGAEDIWIPLELARLTADELPQCQLEVLDQVGHYPHFEVPDVVAEKVSSFAVNVNTARTTS
jgi:pimeloyl-ACP methyl ester carboxylesterase